MGENVASYMSCVVWIGWAARPSEGYVSKDSYITSNSLSTRIGMRLNTNITIACYSEKVRVGRYDSDFLMQGIVINCIVMIGGKKPTW